MRVAVGSLNPVKERATADALDVLAGVTVDPVDVDSGVSEQPTGHAETLAGAETRATNALEAGAYDLGVGIEGGVAELDAATDATTSGLYLIMWAAVTDGDTVGRGSGPGLRLPDRVAERVRAGEELGPVMDDAFDMENVARNEGAVGVLTGNAMDRAEALSAAVSGALGPFVTDAYERDR